MNTIFNEYEYMGINVCIVGWQNHLNVLGAQVGPIALSSSKKMPVVLVKSLGGMVMQIMGGLGTSVSLWSMGIS